MVVSAAQEDFKAKKAAVTINQNHQIWIVHNYATVNHVGDMAAPPGKEPK